jgi:hypothetical protein
MACTDLPNDIDEYPFTFAIVYADPLQFADPRVSSESSFSIRRKNYPHSHGNDSHDILRRSAVLKDDSDDNKNHNNRSAPLALASRSIRRRRTVAINNDPLRSSHGLHLSCHSAVKARDETCLVSDRDHHDTRSDRSTRSASTSRAPRRHGCGTLEINTCNHITPKRKHGSRHTPSVRDNAEDLLSNNNNHSTRSAPAILTSQSIRRGGTIIMSNESPPQSRSIRSLRQLQSPTRRQSMVSFSSTLQSTLKEKCEQYSIVF